MSVSIPLYFCCSTSVTLTTYKCLLQYSYMSVSIPLHVCFSISTCQCTTSICDYHYFFVAGSNSIYLSHALSAYCLYSHSVPHHSLHPVAQYLVVVADAHPVASSDPHA